jgi:putative Mn2+ efflux pump MntP
MKGLDIWLVALSLAMDCFAVSIAIGILLKRIDWRIMLRTALAFGIFQMSMTVIGWACASFFSDLVRNIDHWIAFGLLAVIGINMIIESFKTPDNRTYDPKKWKITLTLALATSIDAAGIGVSFACLGFHSISCGILSASAIIGLVSFIVPWIGFYIGVFGQKTVAKKLHAELLGGIVLLGIGIKILIEHISANL